MGAIELRANLHQLIEGVQNIKLLEMIYAILSSREDHQNGSLWNSLTAYQQKEVLDAFEASEHPDNLISHSQILREIK